MPISYTHAFATGVIYPVKLTSSSMLTRLACFVFWHFLQKLGYLQVRLAIESFTRNAVVGLDCQIGPHAWCVNLGAREHIRLGNSVVCRGILRCENWNDAKLIIGDNVYIGDDCLISCAERVEIGPASLLAHGVQIFDNDSHPLDPLLREQDWLTVSGQRPGPRPSIKSAPVLIGERTWLGVNVLVMKGVHIGEGSVIAAGSVVTTDIPPYTLAAGNPAKVIKPIAMV